MDEVEVEKESKGGCGKLRDMSHMVTMVEGRGMLLQQLQLHLFLRGIITDPKCWGHVFAAGHMITSSPPVRLHQDHIL